MYGSYFFIAIRASVCIIWYGIQSFYGANLVSLCFRCIFGDAWNNWPNTLPVSASVTSKQLLGFFLVWLIEFPFVSGARAILLAILLAKRMERGADMAVLDVRPPQQDTATFHSQGLHYAGSDLWPLCLVYGERFRSR